MNTESTDSIPSRPSVAQINLAHFTSNIENIRQKVQGRKVMGVVKANAYGHGLVPVAKHLEQIGIDYLGVAFLEEGIILRKAGVRSPILVMGGIFSTQIRYYLDFQLEITVSSVDKLKQVEEIAKEANKIASIHLKIDTGMERIGVHSYSSKEMIEKAVQSKYCDVKGIYSHLACSDDPDSPMTQVQIERFQDALQHIEALQVPMPLRHLANSGAILHFPETYFDMVRPGIIIYGVMPDPLAKPTIALQPVLQLESQVVFFKVVQAERPISYGATWTPDHPIRVVTIPIGYGDGYSRAFSNQAEVIIRGKKYPIVGRVCMDQFMVNLEWNTAYNGDAVVLIGTQGQETIRVEELATLANTIPYEILTGLAERIPRVYFQPKE